MSTIATLLTNYSYFSEYSQAKIERGKHVLNSSIRIIRIVAQQSKRIGN